MAEREGRHRDEGRWERNLVTISGGRASVSAGGRRQLNLKSGVMALRANLNPEPMLLNLPDAVGKIAWREVFGNDHPVELEIGSGKGTSLLAMARGAAGA